jgi:hypothetical protein
MPVHVMEEMLLTCRHPFLLPSTDATHQVAADECVRTDLQMCMDMLSNIWSTTFPSLH